MNDTRSAAQDQIQGDAARTDAAASSDGDVTPARRPRRGRLALLAAGLVALIAAGSWLYGQLTHVVVDDARVAADVIAISSRVPGRVTAVNVVEGDTAREGAVLVKIDEREATLVVQELEARIAGIASRRAEIEARIAMIDQQSASQARAQQARVAAARAAVATAMAQRDFAITDFARLDELVKSKAVSRAEWDRARAAAEAARQQVSSAEADIETAKAQLAQAEAGRRELVVLQRQAASLIPEAQQLTAQRDRALIDLRDRTITMPFDGTVDQVFVHTGEYVTPGQRLLMLHDPRRLRVEANVKETDIRYFPPGQRVEVTADAYPDRSFEGTVERVGGAATSEFALLPNPNPSGNFTKITQRIPIRIAMAQQNDLLRPGMMVEVLTRK